MSDSTQLTNNKTIKIDLASVINRSQELFTINQKYFENIITLYITNNFIINFCKFIISNCEKNNEKVVLKILEEIQFVKTANEQITYVLSEVNNIKNITKKIDDTYNKLIIMNMKNTTLIESIKRKQKEINEFHEKTCKVIGFLEIIESNIHNLNGINEKNIYEKISYIENMVIMLYQINNILFPRKPIL